MVICVFSVTILLRVVSDSLFYSNHENTYCHLTIVLVRIFSCVGVSLTPSPLRYGPGPGGDTYLMCESGSIASGTGYRGPERTGHDRVWAGRGRSLPFRPPSALSRRSLNQSLGVVPEHKVGRSRGDGCRNGRFDTFVSSRRPFSTAVSPFSVSEEEGPDLHPLHGAKNTEGRSDGGGRTRHVVLVPDLPKQSLVVPSAEVKRKSFSSG